MKEMGLKACWIKKWHAVPKVKLDSTKLKNLLKQKFNPKRPDAVWCTDITYIWTSEGFMYLSTIMDLFSRKIIAWELSRTMEEEFVIKTVEKAKTERKIKRPLIIHSDRGSHYKADAYIKATEKMKRSYSKVHYPYDNACIESFHSLIKREWLYRFQIQDYEHCQSLVLNISKLFTTQSGFILTVALLHQTNMKQSFRIRILLCDIKRQFKSQFRLGYLLTEEH